MDLPETDFNPPFRITRASHVTLNVTDLGRAKAFYVDSLGFTISDETSDTLYLRGIEEAAHHSLILKLADTPGAGRAGFRCFTEDDIEALKAFFDAEGLANEWVERPYQTRTLIAEDFSGAPVEFCVSMETRPRMINQFDQYRGVRPLRIDHYQIFVPDVLAQSAFYAKMGFRISEFIALSEDGPMVASFMQRKGNPHDVVFLQDSGPAFHHAAFASPEPGDLLHVGDVLVQNGFIGAVEWGPNRHWGPGWGRTIYVVDPDGHRTEFFNNHYQTLDIEDEPVLWTVAEFQARPGWGAPPPLEWQTRATPFDGVTRRAPIGADDPNNKNAFQAIVDE